MKQIQVAKRDFCNKTLSQMGATGEVNKKLSKELKRELSKSTAELNSLKFIRLKTESGVYNEFLKRITDRFKH